MSIDVVGLGKRYGRVEAVRGVDFSVGSGEIVGLLGPNGAGKTTILKMLTGYHFPSFGEARIMGRDVADSSTETRALVGYLPENSPVYQDLNVREYLEFVAVERNVPKARMRESIGRAADECGISDVMEREISTLSKGYQQRLGIAGAVIHSPEILILDEPTTGLDPNQIREIRELIRRVGEEKTVVLSTHILQEVEAVCSRVLILNRGLIVAEGTTESIRRRVEGNPVYAITVREAPDGEALQDSLRHRDGVADLLDFSAEGGEYRAELELEAGRDGALLFRWASDEGYELSELVRRRVSLEEVFENLTMEGGEGGAHAT
jgi:ABC-2 type transport system ATP-binding protein